MATINKFEDIEAWKEARKLSNEVFKIIGEGAFSKDYKLRDQINGSSGSIMDNIAEGFERDGKREFIQFLSIAKASCGETKSQLYRSYDRGYIAKEKFEELYNLSTKISKMISGFMSYLKDSDYSGTKFAEPVFSYNNQPET